MSSYIIDQHDFVVERRMRYFGDIPRMSLVKHGNFLTFGVGSKFTMEIEVMKKTTNDDYLFILKDGFNHQVVSFESSSSYRTVIEELPWQGRAKDFSFYLEFVEDASPVSHYMVLYESGICVIDDKYVIDERVVKIGYEFDVLLTNGKYVSYECIENVFDGNESPNDIFPFLCRDVVQCNYRSYAIGWYDDLLYSERDGNVISKMRFKKFIRDMVLGYDNKIYKITGDDNLVWTGGYHIKSLWPNKCRSCQNDLTFEFTE